MVDVINATNIQEDSKNEFFNVFEEEIKPFSDEIDSIFATVKGFVRDSLGRPLEGALVKLMSLTYEPILHDVTDINGEYKIINVEANIYKIYAVYPDKILPEGETITVAPSQEIEKDFMLEDDLDMKLVLIAGDVFDQNSKEPLEKVLVRLFYIKPNEEKLVGITTTNKYGQFTFRDLNLGDYKVEISATGYHISVITMNAIIPGKILPLKVFLLKNDFKGTISGVIGDENEELIEDADVILYKLEEDNSLTPIDFTKTDDEGVYLFQNVEPQTYKIKANQSNVVKIPSPNSPLYYSFAIANASILEPIGSFVEYDADIYGTASYVFNKQFIKDIDGTTGGYMTINVDALFSGYYNVNIEYLSGFSNSTIILQEDSDNNGKQTILNFPQTLGWNVEDSKTIRINIPLYAGINQFKLFNTLGATSPWIGEFSIVYIERFYNKESVEGVISNGALINFPFVTNLGGSNKGEVIVPFNAPFSKAYELEIDYLSGDNDRLLMIDLDGVNIDNFTVDKTNDWSIASKKTYNLRVELEEGERKFKFYNNTGEYAPHIGTLTFKEYVVNKKFYPKDVNLIDDANIKTDITGLEYIDGVIQGKGTIEFSLEVFETQLYDFQISYKCNDIRSCNIRINDENVIYEKFIFRPTGDSLGKVTFKLYLELGVNVITVYND